MQAMKGIATFTAGPWNGRAAPLDAATSVDSAKGASALTPVSKGMAQTPGADRKKTGCWGSYKQRTPEMDLCHI